MVAINLTDKEAQVIYAIASEVELVDGIILDKLWRKYSAAQTNANFKTLKMFTGSKAKNITANDVSGPLTHIKNILK